MTRTRCSGSEAMTTAKTTQPTGEPTGVGPRAQAPSTGATPARGASRGDNAQWRAATAGPT
eukprot:15470759-Alexandrium_andersonii.AAC.1